MNKLFVPTKIDWWGCALIAVEAPASIYYVRQVVMDRYFHLSAFDFLPLHGAVSGWRPHLYFRIVYDVTHPAFLLGYAAILSWVTLRTMRRPMSANTSTFAMFGLSLVHVALLAFYYSSFLSPLCVMREIISSR